jgi:uncharacterized protein Yka (UPF0111/DUF47 family)
MLGMFKSDPLKKLQKDYEKKLEQAMEASRNGDMRANAELTEEAEALREKIDQLKSDQLKS